MRLKTSKYISSLILVAALASCSDDPADTGGDQTIPEYLKETWGISLSQFEGDGFILGDDGTQLNFDDRVITVDGLGQQEVSTMTIIDPVALGGQVSFFVSNLDLSDERYFLYDPVENYITIGDLTRGVAVSKNPDETYDVWAFDGEAMDNFSTVPNGLEALKLVEQYNEFKSISPYLLLTAFAAAQSGTPEARALPGNTDPGNGASPPPVCEIFKEFCECAACLVLDRAGACEPCPGL
jgi:hypothetical protein